MRSLVALSTLLVAAWLTGSAPAEAIELKLSVETPPAHARNQAAARWAEEVAKLSKGDVTIAIFPAGQLYDSAGAVRALASGALDLSIQANPTLSQFEPNLSVITLPMFFGSTREHVRAIFDGPLGAELYKMVEAKGIVVPGGHFEFAPQHTAYTTSKPIKSYADLKGTKLATPPSPVVVALLKAMGADPVATPRTEVVLQLTQGRIDGMGMVTDLTISGGKMWEAGIKYGFIDNAGWGVYIPLVGKPTWDKLTADQRKALVDAWNNTRDWARAFTADELAKGIEANKASGVQYFSPTAADSAEMRTKLAGEQAEIVKNGRMSADYVAKVEARLKELQK